MGPGTSQQSWPAVQQLLLQQNSVPAHVMPAQGGAVAHVPMSQ
jgi:hypothetical protein